MAADYVTTTRSRTSSPIAYLKDILNTNHIWLIYVNLDGTIGISILSVS
jgi:hypothetical protein